MQQLLLPVKKQLKVMGDGLSSDEGDGLRIKGDDTRKSANIHPP
jgi:hypothetical protein